MSISNISQTYLSNNLVYIGYVTYVDRRVLIYSHLVLIETLNISIFESVYNYKNQSVPTGIIFLL